MRRVVILGCSGSGKSTLARRLGDRLGLPAVHLDALYFLPGWKIRPKEEFLANVAKAIQGDGWICEGGYSETYRMRFPRADTVIWLERPRWLYLTRVILRIVQTFGRTRADMAPGCPERFDLEFLRYVWNWQKKTRPKLEAGLAQYCPDTPLTVLSSDREVREFLHGLPHPLIPESGDPDV